MQQKNIMKIPRRFCIFILIAWTGACSAGEVNNLLRNGSFEAGRTGWMLDAKPRGATLEIQKDKDAVDGNQIAVVQVGAECSLATFAAEWVNLNPGTDYAFRLNLRSDTPGIEAALSVWSWADASGKWNQKTESTKTVTLSEVWQACELTANLEPARAGKYQARVQLRSPGTIYVDDASLLPGGDIATQPSFETGLECHQPGGLFDITETPNAVAFIYNRTPVPMDVELHAVLTDLKDNPVWRASEVLQVPAGSTLEKHLELPVEKRGYFKLKTEVTHAGQTRRCELAFAVIDQNREPPDTNSYFGVDMASHNLERQLQRARAMGIGNIRVHESLNWKEIEKKRGEFEWPQAAHYNAYQDAGFQVLVYFDDGVSKAVPSWTSGLSKEEITGLYADFCAKSAQHYSGMINDFEIINEPWGHMGAQEYSDILQSACPKIKAANPDATLAAVTGYSGPQVDFIKKITQTDAMDSMDVFTLHPYPRPACPEPSLIDMLQQTRGWLDDAGWAGPVWITEMGWTTPGKQPLPTRIPRPSIRNNTEFERALYMVRSYMISIANGVDRLYWFYFSGDNNFYYSYDMFECDSNDSVMKTVPVYAAMTSRLKNYRFEKTLSEGNGDIYAYLFRNGTQRQIVAWNSGNTESGQFLRHSGQVTALYDMVGNPIAQPSKVGDLSFIPLSGAPVYIELEDSSVAPEVITPLSIHTAQNGTDVQGQLTVSNIFSAPCSLDATLCLPDYAMPTRSLKETIHLAQGEEKTIPFSFTVAPDKTAISDALTINTTVSLNTNRFTLKPASHFLYSKPLPQIHTALTLDAADYDSSSFTPDPLWEPHLLRCYSGQNLLLKRRAFDEDKEELVLEYQFNVETPGHFHLMISGSPFESDEDLAWSINGGPVESNASSSQIGKPWVYSTHPDMWWRFKCAWHDMGPALLHEGENRLRIHLNNPRQADNGYTALDVISFVSDEELNLLN
jgi:hypothetical protein